MTLLIEWVVIRNLRDAWIWPTCRNLVLIKEIFRSSLTAVLANKIVATQDFILRTYSSTQLVLAVNEAFQYFFAVTYCRVRIPDTGINNTNYNTISFNTKCLDFVNVGKPVN